MKPIGYHREAEAEVEEAIAYLERQRQGRGLEFQTRVEDATRRIQGNPKLYSQYKDTEYRKCLVQGFPYSIFYRELEDCIWIAAVAHQKRRPGYWMGRDPGDG